ncbi:Uncharacterised protein [Klebsiella pneumoniae]|nr:Uncharacterised protein [Klebsiella pneumoniae]
MYNNVVALFCTFDPRQLRKLLRTSEGDDDLCHVDARKQWRGLICWQGTRQCPADITACVTNLAFNFSDTAYCIRCK